MKIFNKMFLSCLLVTLLISLISGGITYYIASDIILNKTVMQTEETIKQISENYDSFMKLVYNKLDYLAFNPTVQEELIYGKPGEDEEGYYSGTRKLKRLMVQMFNSIHMEDMEIYGENGKEYFCSILYQAPDLPNTEELKQTARERMGAIVCVNDIGTSGNLQVVKEIKDILSMQSLGILRTSIRLSALERIQHNVDFASSGKIILLDDNNKIILGEKSELTDKADDLFVKWDDSFRYEIEGAPYQVIYQVSEYTGWKTIGILPDKEIPYASADRNRGGGSTGYSSESGPVSHYVLLSCPSDHQYSGGTEKVLKGRFQSPPGGGEERRIRRDESGVQFYDPKGGKTAGRDCTQPCFK